MDDRNKDLPLIVSEILIEMHEMKEAINRLSSTVMKQQEHMNSMFNVVLDENKKNMAFMISMMAEGRQENATLIQEVRQENATLIQEVRQETVVLTEKARQENATLIQEVRQETVVLMEKARQENATLIQEVRQETTVLVEKGRQEAQQDREFMTYSLNKAMGQQQQVNNAFEKRLVELEAKYDG